jgi:hypothetical protein
VDATSLLPPGEATRVAAVRPARAQQKRRREEILCRRAEAARWRLAEERRAPERVTRQLERLYVDEHLSVAEIARRLGRSDHWVRTVLIQALSRGGQAPLAGSPRRRCVGAEVGSGPAKPALCAQAW